MLTHVVLWSFKESASAADRDKVVKGLGHKAPEMRSLSIGENKTKSTRVDGYTHLYVSTFDDFDSLARFQEHADHVPISKLLVAIADKLTVADIVS